MAEGVTHTLPSATLEEQASSDMPFPMFLLITLSLANALTLPYLSPPPGFVSFQQEGAEEGPELGQRGDGGDLLLLR